MILANVNKADIPVVPVRNGLTINSVGLEALKSSGVGLVSYGLKEGDTFEFPTTAADLQITQRQVRANSSAYEYLVLGLKNGKPAWLSVSNLRRWDHKMQPVHPVAEALRTAEDDSVRLEMCLGKTIKAEEDVTYQEAVFENGVRTDGTRPRTVSKLVFA